MFRPSLLTIVALGATASVQGAFLPVVNPGFATTDDATGNPIAPPSYTAGFGSGVPLGDANTGAFFGTATVNGYTSTSSAGVVDADATEYSQGAPTGPGGYVSIGPGGPAQTISQTLTGTSLAPDTTYTLSVSVFDRRYGAGDNVSFPSAITLAFTVGGTVLTGATQTGSAPVPGGNSTYTLVYTTGDLVSTGDFGFSLGGSGYNGLAASQAVFDNVTINAAGTPEPAALGLLGLGSLMTLRRHRRPG